MIGALRRLVGIALAVLPLVVSAHKQSDSYLTLTVPSVGTVIDGQWDIALRDLDFAIGLDANHDGAITWGEVRLARDRIAGYALSRLTIEAIGQGERQPCSSALTDLLVDRHVDGQYAVLRFVADCGVQPVELKTHYSLLFDVDPTHHGLLNVIAAGRPQAAVLSTDSPSVGINARSPDRRQQLLAFVTEGIWHILKGYDHILFLLTLLLPAVVRYGTLGWEARGTLKESAREVLEVVTAFTLAHSLTLSLAVLSIVRLPSRWVESGIAVTVLLGALNNLRPVVVRRRWVVAFIFGLVHGFGFAAILADLGLKGVNLALSLVGFNSGVELGQLLIVAFVLPLAFLVRASPVYRRAFMPAGAVAISVVATYWLIARLTGLSFG